MRALSTSFMAALIVVALFWGNCLSCPQVLLSVKAHACCKRSQKPATKQCDSQGLQHFLKSDPGTWQQPAAVAEPVAMETASAPVFAAAPLSPDAPLHSSPDLLSLHSSFRI